MSHNCALSLTRPVLCVGCLSIDLLTLCATLPQEHKDQSCLDAKWQRGGHCSNVSMVLRILGVQVEFLGVLSRSSMLSVILKEMERCGIDFKYCPKTDEEPAFSTIMTELRTSRRSIVQCTRNFPYATIDDFKKIDLNCYGWVHFEGRNVLDTIPMMRAILDYNNGRKEQERIRISVKVKSCYKQNIDLFDMCDYVLFSRQLALEQGWQTPQEACLELDKELPLPRSLHLRRPCFICSWGRLGAGCLSAQGDYHELPAYIPRQIEDTYGVGESFTAAFIYAMYIREMGLAAAVDFANRVAGHKVTGSGHKHIANMNIYPITVTNVDESHSCNTSQDEEAEQRICQKYLKRKIQYSDGKYATKLLGTTLCDTEAMEEGSLQATETEEEPRASLYKSSLKTVIKKTGPTEDRLTGRKSVVIKMKRNK